MKITDILNITYNQPTVVVKKPKQKKWIPPLQQMLDMMKNSMNPTKKAGEIQNLAISDPVISLAESSDNSIQEIKLCEDCGHIILPKDINEELRCRIEDKWAILKEKIAGHSKKCDSH